MVPAYENGFFAGTFLDDDSRRLACLAFWRSALLAPLTTPVDVSYLEMAVAIDAIQHLSGWTPTQMLQEYRKGRKPKLDSTATVVAPLWTLRIPAKSFRVDVRPVLRRL